MIPNHGGAGVTPGRPAFRGVCHRPDLEDKSKAFSRVILQPGINRKEKDRNKNNLTVQIWYTVNFINVQNSK